MATLHIFNPEHDISLAAHLANFTPPRAAWQLRHDLGWLPALWAEDGDMVLVDADMPEPPPEWRLADVQMVTERDLANSPTLRRRIDAVSPWGWDRAVAGRLSRCGLSDLLPTDEALCQIRRMSHRAFAATRLLPALVALDGRLVGEAQCVATYPPATCQPFVLKSPWSSTGRGIRYVTDEASWRRNQLWAQAVVERQGGVMVEPLYERVQDFAMEFLTTPDRETTYLGLSIFQTQNGAYTGNLLAAEAQKRALLGCYVDLALLDRVGEVVARWAKQHLAPHYAGPFGVDMMVVRSANPVPSETATYRLHPCVELNLRRTMGHVALAIPLTTATEGRLLAMCFDGHHSLQIV